MSSSSKPAASRPEPYIPEIGRSVVKKVTAEAGIELIDLSLNESSFGASPRATAAAIERSRQLMRYPDPDSTALRQAIGKRFGLDPECIVCGNGSEDIIDCIGRQVKTYEVPYLYSSKIEVFVDGAGELQVIAIGSGPDSTPMIVHLNQHLAPQWQATVPDRLNSLTMLNLKNAEHGPLFVAASNKGTVYIFDTEGTLLYRDTLVESGETFYSIEGAVVNDNIGYIIPRLAEGFRRYRVQW